MSTPRILLVDDVEFFLEIEKGFLRQTPAEIMTARNGREALEVASSFRPSVIFMDVQMPEMDGITCLRKLKADPKLESIPVIMVFAPNKDTDASCCMEAGAVGVLHKPVDRVEFLELGHQYLFAIDRRERRIPCQALVKVNWQGREFHCRSEDLSAGGAYINSREEIPVGERVRLTLVLPGSGARVLQCKGRVTWLNQGFPRPCLGMAQGFGVEFKELGKEKTQELAEFIERYGAAPRDPHTAGQ